jgi:hypothetical protein
MIIGYYYGMEKWKKLVNWNPVVAICGSPSNFTVIWAISG